MMQNTPIIDIKGIGEKTAELFEKIDIRTMEELLRYYPRDYIRYPKAISFPLEAELTEGVVALRATVFRSPVVKKTARMPITLLEVGDSVNRVQVVWYRMPYIKNTVLPGKQYVFYGRLGKKNGKFVLEQPTVYPWEQYEGMELLFAPLYSLTAGLTNNQVTKAVRGALLKDGLLLDNLPVGIRKNQSLCEYNYAIKQIHFPDSMESLTQARRRLVFDEFFYFILGMQYQKKRQEREKNHFPLQADDFTEELVKKLPYALTGAQRKALSDIKADMTGSYVMQRLIQGDVGSGKTIVAFLAMAWTSENGFQSAIMAPTEVLAKQHFETYEALCRQFGLDFPVILLTGSMTAAQKRKVYEKLQETPNAMVIGTHALIQEKAVYANLALVITDEQHRFGVHQRETFSEKGKSPHILVMSATPIPRTLAIILYGDLDISVIDEVPARRLPIKNCVVGSSYREKSYAFIEEQVQTGHQAYVICPLVEESENLEAENVETYSRKLREHWEGRVSVGMLHGKMKPAQKNRIMEQFAKNEIQVLVSTTVVEVGVNVPNATVMMIENANRYGLAQLHQLRGRVGRGDAQSYCIMINTADNQIAKQRLEILNRSNDGFYIAGEDLKLRGPGDFFGIRQSGELLFALADVYQDADVMKRAAEEVGTVLAEDPELEKEENRGLFREMKRFMEERAGKMNL